MGSAIQRQAHDGAEQRARGVGGFGHGHHEGDVGSSDDDEVHGIVFTASAGSVAMRQWVGNNEPRGDRQGLRRCERSTIEERAPESP